MSSIKKRVQNIYDDDNTNYFTPNKIVSFNKLLKSMVKSQKKHTVSPIPLVSKIPTLKRTKSYRCIDNNYNNVGSHSYFEPISIKEPIQENKIINVDINVEINIISDLIKLTEIYKLDENIHYNIDMKSLHAIKDELIVLNNMIGMKEFKKNIVYQILYFIQELNKNSNEYMHTVIYGNSGTGKTEVAKIIGRIFSKIGLLNKGTFKKVTRSDLIAGYVGQTAIKTKEVVKEALGGVLFIDEAYALGNNETKDTFSKECIDTLCEALSDYKENLMVIIAGYENELNECFFNYNQGLFSRFAWRFKMDDYSGQELYQIFIKKVKDINWETTQEIAPSWFDKNIEQFQFYGRDIENLLAKTKIVHSKRVFCKNASEKRKIKLEDLENGFTMYLNNNDTKNNRETNYVKKQLQYSMYN